MPSLLNELPKLQWTLTTDLGVIIHLPCSPWMIAYHTKQKRYVVTCEQKQYWVHSLEAKRLLTQIRMAYMGQFLMKDKGTNDDA